MRSMVEGACGGRYRLGRSPSTTAFGDVQVELPPAIPAPCGARGDLLIPLSLRERNARRRRHPLYPTGYAT